MKTSLYLLIAAMSFVASAPAQTSIPPKIPVRDFFRNPETTAYQLSPSGDYIAFLKPYENRLNIWVQRRQGGEPTRITSVTDRDISSFAWKGDKYLLYAKDNGGDENYHLYAADRDGQAVRELTPFEGVKVRIVDDLEDNPTDVIIEMNKRNKEFFDAYRLNVEAGDMKVVAENPGNISGWMTDHDGNLRVATTTDGVNTSLLYRKTDQDPWKPILTTNFKEAFDPQFFTFDNQNLYGVSNLGRDKSAVVEFDLGSG